MIEKTPGGKYKARVSFGDERYHVGLFGSQEAAMTEPTSDVEAAERFVREMNATTLRVISVDEVAAIIAEVRAERDARAQPKGGA